MATRKTRTKAKPKPFDLLSHLDIEVEAEKFDVPVARAAVIAKKVEREPPEEPSIFLTTTRNESELRDRFVTIYNEEVQKLSVCNWSDCAVEFTSLEQFITHHRLHLITCNNPQVSRAALADLEAICFPSQQTTVEAVLNPEERKTLAEARRKRKLFDKQGKH